MVAKQQGVTKFLSGQLTLNLKTFMVIIGMGWALITYWAQQQAVLNRIDNNLKAISINSNRIDSLDGAYPKIADLDANIKVLIERVSNLQQAVTEIKTK